MKFTTGLPTSNKTSAAQEIHSKIRTHLSWNWDPVWKITMDFPNPVAFGHHPQRNLVSWLQSSFQSARDNCGHLGNWIPTVAHSHPYAECGGAAKCGACSQKVLLLSRPERHGLVWDMPNLSDAFGVTHSGRCPQVTEWAGSWSMHHLLLTVLSRLTMGYTL